MSAQIRFFLHSTTMRPTGAMMGFALLSALEGVL